MTIYICRHGRTEANASGLLLGRADPALDPSGVEQAAAIAAALPAGATVYSSPLQRCLLTASAYADDIIVDDRLIELDYGDLDLMPLAEVPAETWKQWRADTSFAPPNGESLQQLFDRVSAFLDEISQVEGDVALFSHVSPIKAAMAWALGCGVEISWRSHVAQASISVVEVSGRGPSLHAFNRVDHLG